MCITPTAESTIPSRAWGSSASHRTERRPKHETSSQSTSSTLTPMRDLFLDLPWCYGSGKALMRAGVAVM